MPAKSECWRSWQWFPPRWKTRYVLWLRLLAANQKRAGFFIKPDRTTAEDAELPCEFRRGSDSPRDRGRSGRCDGVHRGLFVEKNEVLPRSEVEFADIRCASLSQPQASGTSGSLHWRSIPTSCPKSNVYQSTANIGGMASAGNWWRASACNSPESAASKRSWPSAPATEFFIECGFTYCLTGPRFALSSGPATTDRHRSVCGVHRCPDQARHAHRFQGRLAG